MKLITIVRCPYKWMENKYNNSTSVTKWMPYCEKKTSYQSKAAAEEFNDGINMRSINTHQFITNWYYRRKKNELLL